MTSVRTAGMHELNPRIWHQTLFTPWRGRFGARRPGIETHAESDMTPPPLLAARRCGTTAAPFTRPPAQEHGHDRHADGPRHPNRARARTGPVAVHPRRHASELERGADGGGMGQRDPRAAAVVRLRRIPPPLAGADAAGADAAGAG